MPILHLQPLGPTGSSTALVQELRLRHLSHGSCERKELYAPNPFRARQSVPKSHRVHHDPINNSVMSQGAL